MHNTMYVHLCLHVDEIENTLLTYVHVHNVHVHVHVCIELQMCNCTVE